MLTKQQQIDELERALVREKKITEERIGDVRFLKTELDATARRVNDITRENESLRRDKAWLQQMIERFLRLQSSSPSIQDMLNAKPR